MENKIKENFVYALKLGLPSTMEKWKIQNIKGKHYIQKYI